jgi:hypothetical protein
MTLKARKIAVKSRVESVVGSESRQSRQKVGKSRTSSKAQEIVRSGFQAESFRSDHSKMGIEFSYGMISENGQMFIF